jgi:outer membrane protein TolC
MDLESSALRRESIAVRAERVQRLEAVGLVSKEEGAALKREAEAEAGRAEEIRGRIALRERFLKGKADALQVEIQGRLAEVALRLKSAQARVESTQEKLERLTRMADLGLVPVSEVRTAQAGLEIAKAELAQAVLERDILSQVK